MSIYIRPFQKEDLGAFKTVEPITQAQEITLELAEAMEKANLSVTGIRNGKIIGCGGVHPTMVKEQGELWLRLSKECRKCKIEILRTLKEALKIIEEEFGFEQLNAIIRCDFEPSIKLIKFLGFRLTQKKDRWLIFSKRAKE